MTFCGLSGRLLHLYLKDTSHPLNGGKIYSAIQHSYKKNYKKEFTMETNIFLRISFQHQRPIIHSESLKKRNKE